MPEPEKLPEKLTCPECGEDLADKDPWAHALMHWPEHLDPRKDSSEAMKRQAQLQKWARAKGLI